MKRNGFLKSVLLLFGVLIFAVNSSLVIFAASTENRIFAESTSVKQGNLISVPVQINNNTGFMGFSMIVSYDSNALTPVSAEKGTILSGMFNDSIGVDGNNVFKVVYSGTNDCTQDGTLFTLNFTAKESYSGNTAIKLDYSQPDTFNENWEDVVFQCEDIQVSVISGETVPTNPVQKTVSERMLDWLYGLPKVLMYLLWIFVRPLAFFISLFE